MNYAGVKTSYQDFLMMPASHLRKSLNWLDQQLAREKAELQSARSKSK